MATSVPPATPNEEPSDINNITTNLDRMENVALMEQRVELSDQQVERMKMLAVGAKLERALTRRMTGQDAVMRPRGHSLGEKHKEETIKEVVSIGTG